MKVLHLTDHYLPVLGGIELHVASLAERQAARGNDVTVLTSTPASADGQHGLDMGRVRVRRVRSLLEGVAFDVTSYDVVHVHVSVVAPFSAPVAALIARRGAPTIVTVHSLWNGMGPIPATFAGLAGLRGAPVVWTAVSRVAAEHLTRRLPRGTVVRVLPNAVDVAPREHVRERPADGRVQLVSTMRIARRKRPLQLLAMFEALQSAVDVPVDLTIVGDGPLRQRLERRLHRMRLVGRVTITGRVDPEEVRGILATSDVYVAPAILESFGLAALEARSVGLPVVGRAGTGMTEFIRPGVEGLLSRSDHEMVRHLRWLVTNDRLRHSISEFNRTNASGLTWAHALERHDAVYALVAPVVASGASATSAGVPTGVER